MLAPPRLIAFQAPAWKRQPITYCAAWHAQAQAALDRRPDPCTEAPTAHAVRGMLMHKQQRAGRGRAWAVGVGAGMIRCWHEQVLGCKVGCVGRHGGRRRAWGGLGGPSHFSTICSAKRACLRRLPVQAGRTGQGKQQDADEPGA